MLNSEKIYSGVEHADARSLLYATGHLQENIGRKPLIGVVNTFNEIVPGHFHLRGIADAAKQGVLMAGGVPVEFPTIAICDGITMAHKGMMYPLPSRELIADSIESMTMAHGLDGLVLVVSCDKTIPRHCHQRRPHAHRALSGAGLRLQRLHRNCGQSA